LEYLNALLDAGEADRAAAAVPRDHEGGSTFTLVDRYQFVGSATEAPVNWVTMEIAEAYLRWRSLKSMCTARFPTDFEWEKAARGVDGRFFPWGSFLDFSRCNIRSRELGPVPCDRYPIDVSPYGVKSVAGNVKNWVVADERAGEVGVRGAAWMGGPRNARAASRLGPLDSSNRFEQSGRAALRIARSVP